MSLVCAADAAVLGSASAQRSAGPSARRSASRYNVEAALSFWSADPDLIVSSESLGIPGDDVDLINDLGIEKKRLSELRARPASGHQAQVPHPLHADQVRGEAVVQREFVFNGQRYRIGLPVSTEADFTTWRFGYEYDFIYRDRGYLGVLIDLKYTNVDVVLDSPIGAEFTEPGGADSRPRRRRARLRCAQRVDHRRV